MDPLPPLGRGTWHKACNTGSCLEVARRGDTVLLRDGKNPTGPMLTISGDEWEAFLSEAKNGGFDMEQLTE